MWKDRVKKLMLTPTSLLHIIPLDSKISLKAEDARMYAFFLKFCSLKYDAATSEGKIISSCNTEMLYYNTGQQKEIT
jgi:hypothetical protein